ncbi:MAG TPA: hypothetical protein VLB80_00820 [Candidatus Babeliales bacterium]|nr:hypothetical protein [Candidatus Babeliales bacterium]
MKPIQRFKKIIIIAFVLSLLLHVGSIIYIFWQKNNGYIKNHIKNDENELQKKIRKEDIWAETKARSGSPSAQVLFQDEPEHTESPQEETLPLQEKITIQNRPEDSTILTTPLPEMHITTDTSIKPSSPTQFPTKKPGYQTPPAPIKKQPLSLAQLTQGFLNHNHNEGKHRINVLGKKNSTPSDEQIKHERYLQRLSLCLQNSFNINSYNCPISLPKDTIVHVFLALNRDGTIKQLHITQTSGDRNLDAFTLLVFREAGGSFPPVPTYLPCNPFIINYVVGVNSIERNNITLYRR